MKIVWGKMGGAPAYWCRYSHDTAGPDRVEPVCIHASAAEIRAWARQDLPANGRLLKTVIDQYFQDRVQAAIVSPVRPN